MRALVILLFFGLLYSCSPKIRTSKEELSKFSIKNDTIFYVNDAVARIYNYEYEHYRGHRTLEISIESFNHLDNRTESLIDWVLTKKRNAKVEIREPIRNFEN